MDEPKLLPCPFCGGPAMMQNYMDCGELSFEVICHGCPGTVGCADTPDDIATRWNTRPLEDALSARVAELEAALEKWRNYQPDDEDLRDMADQARAKDGTYTNGLAAQFVYIKGLEAALAAAQARIDMLYPFNPQNYPANG